MSAVICILYPTGHDFDLKYYMSTHMPLVSSTWKSKGLQSWEIVKLDGDKYQIQAILKWDSIAAWETEKTQPSYKTVIDDIANFTTAKPDVIRGEHQGSEKLF